MGRKTYIKLKGGEVAAAKDLKRAVRFMNWYAGYSRYLPRRLKTNYNADVAIDAMILVYDCIAFKGAIARNYKSYYLQAYYTTMLKTRKAKALFHETHVSVHDDNPGWDCDTGDGVNFRTYGNPHDIAAAEFDSAAYEGAVTKITGEMYEHVRDNYDPLAASIFEIYIALLPDMSYKKLAQLLGYSESRIYLEITPIRTDLRNTFKSANLNLLC